MKAIIVHQKEKSIEKYSAHLGEWKEKEKRG